MWEQYETPEEKRENAASSSPEPSPPHDTDQPPTISVFPPGVPRSRPTRDSNDPFGDSGLSDSYGDAGYDY